MDVGRMAGLLSSCTLVAPLQTRTAGVESWTHGKE